MTVSPCKLPQEERNDACGPAEAGAQLDVGQLFREFSPYVASVALRLLGRDVEIDDIVQEVFVRAIRGLGELRQNGAVKPWLATVTVRVARGRLRVRRLRTWVGLDDVSDYEALVAPGASQEDRALLSRVYVALDRLPVEQRVAWVLRHIQGDDLDSVASACGCSLATAKRRIAAAHTRIESMVGDG